MCPFYIPLNFQIIFSSAFMFWMYQHKMLCISNTATRFHLHVLMHLQMSQNKRNAKMRVVLAKVCGIVIFLSFSTYEWNSGAALKYSFRKKKTFEMQLQSPMSCVGIGFRLLLLGEVIKQELKPLCISMNVYQEHRAMFTKLHH